MVKGDHTYAKVTGNETFSTHNPNGNILYGIEVFIHLDDWASGCPPYVHEYRKELCGEVEPEGRSCSAGRIPNYYKYADLKASEGIHREGALHRRSTTRCSPSSSPTIYVRKVMMNYLPNDEESKHCRFTLLRRDNI